eukprot:5819005-Pleurochrysis_carterae.AAC.2
MTMRSPALPRVTDAQIRECKRVQTGLFAPASRQPSSGIAHARARVLVVARLSNQNGVCVERGLESNEARGRTNHLKHLHCSRPGIVSVSVERVRANEGACRKEVCRRLRPVGGVERELLGEPLHDGVQPPRADVLDVAVDLRCAHTKGVSENKGKRNG